MAEELTKYLSRISIRCRYIHSDVDTLERVQIMQDLRKGLFDVLIGVNLLREGLDLPEVSLVAIIDADKEGFLRSNRSLTQTVGRAARNLNGKAIMYADSITDSMQLTIDQTTYRRSVQEKYNQTHGITPKALNKSIETVLIGRKKETEPKSAAKIISEKELAYMSGTDIKEQISLTRKAMEAAAKSLDFIEAARLRDQLQTLQGKA